MDTKGWSHKKNNNSTYITNESSFPEINQIHGSIKERLTLNMVIRLQKIDFIVFRMI